MKKLFAFLLFAGILSFIPSSLSAQIPSNGLVAWYPFNGNANDESGNGNNGVVNGATLTSDRFGNANGAYSFDGVGGFIEILDSPLLDFTSSYSLVAWINLNGFASAENLVSGVLNKERYTGATGYGLDITSAGQVGENFNNVPQGGGQGVNLPFYSSQIINVNSWHHLVSVHDGTRRQYFLDGMQLLDESFAHTLLVSNQSLFIGKEFSGNSGPYNNRYFNGKIDDVALYNRALDASEIQQLYQDQTGQIQPPLTCNITAPTTTLCAGESVNLSITTTGGAGSFTQLPANLQQGLVAYYPFNGNANDESGNGFNAVVTESLPFVNDRVGYANSAIYFTGANCNSQVSSLINPSLIQGELTISFWVKKTELGCEGSRMMASYFSQIGILNNTNGHFQIIDNNSGFSINHIVGSGSTYSSEYSNIEQMWTLISYVNDGVKGKFFKNGNLFDEHTNPIDGTITLGDKIILGHLGNTWSDDAFKGYMDDVMIWGRALTNSEIQQLYTSQSYAWSTGATTNSITVSPTTTTTYSCTVTSGLQTCTTSVDIVVNTPVAVTAQIEQVLAVDQPNFALNMTTNVGFNNTALAISPVVANNNSSTAALLNNTNASSGYANASGGNNMAISAATGAFNANTSSYFQWNVQVGNVQSAVLNNLSFGYRSSTSNAGPTQYCIRSSADNFASNIAQGSISNTSAWLLQNVALTLNLTSNATTTMRLYVFGGTGTSGNVNFRMDDLSWNFTTTSASCSDQGIQFLSNVSNAIDNPTYSWLVNGNPVSSDANFSSTALVQNDQVQLEVTPTTGCYVSGPTASNVVSVMVNSIVTPTVLVSNNVSATNTQQLYNMTTAAASVNTVTNGTVGVSYSGFASSASNASTGYVGASGGNNMVASIPSGAINTGQYVDINVAANAGYGLTLKGMSWGYRSSATNGGPKFYAIRSSVDNYAQDLATGNLVNNSLWQNISLSDLPLAMVQNGSPVTFRVYFYGGTTLQGAANFRIDDWSLNLQEQAIPCNTQPIQFSASVTNGGNAPHYNWQLNGASVGTDLSTFTASNYQNGDVVSVVVQTNAACQTTSSVSASGYTIIAVNGQSYFQDADNDGYGNNAIVTAACVQPTGYVTNNTDCNDASSTVSPAATEICWNQIDDNCDGQVDENCFIYGCMNADACNYNPAATADDGSCILPQNEICNGLDDNCNGQIDEGLTLTSVTATPVSTNVFPTCSGNGIKPANLNVGTNSSIIEGNGLDLWYSLTAQYNTLRAGLSAAFGDNEIRLYQYNNGCFQLIEMEHEVYTTTTQGTGNQVLISDDLIPGQTYYVAVHNISGAMNTSAKMCFNHFVESSCDHYYSNYTGIYPNVCTSFKAQYKGNASNYIFNILSGTQNGQNMNITPWSYATGSALSVVSRIGSVFPVNMTASARTYTLNVPVVYSIPDAAGNYTSITANGTSTCTVTMSPETTIALRSIDRCPNIKTTTSSVAIDRTICGALRYEWEFTQQLPTVQPAVTVMGGLNSSVLFLNNVPGMGLSKTYNVRVRPIHANGEVGNWGSVQCLKTGTSGMVLQSENENESDSPIYQYTHSPIHYAIYPNPTSTGHFTITSNFTSEYEVKQIAILDITGKMVYTTQVVMNGNAVEIEYGQLASGVYVVMVGEERIRLIVE